jgi:hypothetical protein
MRATAQRLLPAVAASLMLAMALAGCSPSNPTPTPTRTASVPVFTSDAQALKAATEAYAAYLKMSDTIAHEGGADPERIKQYATGDALSLFMQGAAKYKEASAHSIGQTTAGAYKFQSVTNSRVRFYVCEDISNVELLDAAGRSLVVPGRDPKTAFEVTAIETNARLLIESRNVWPGGGVCE